ncbi:hypothetical protein DICPUDRAFT_152126 [Dictyostelium purpureum]|uniref:Uncharacterized protein n=1 Tax=Dictyostelium purpureum TaxID=5786 RepID=F0ZKJ4_DICPU|nr:uncharacterized protein DICPUDRAFT_152126 [Dictyostelium purpureum]EGC35567.1 hypothetical protein DICPUDRAFT_152126 [Dictyostelium purpureum]|eukprot:XP_003287938.1 hypothetical protein DICPUDRAFT_152126 [Dictyostelium purpureum]
MFTKEYVLLLCFFGRYDEIKQILSTTECIMHFFRYSRIQTPRGIFNECFKVCFERPSKQREKQLSYLFSDLITDGHIHLFKLFVAQYHNASKLEGNIASWFSRQNISYMVRASIEYASNMHVLSSVGVWNDEKNAYIGSIELQKVTSNVGKAYEGFQHMGSQTSTYNYTSKQLSFIIKQNGTENKFLHSVDTTTWKEINTSSIGKDYNYTGLAFDNTTDAFNLFGTYTNGDNNLHVCKISPSDHASKNTHTFPGELCSTFFHSKLNTYYVFYTKPSNPEQIYVNSYDMKASPVSLDQAYEVKNVGKGYKPIPSTLKNLAYIPNKDLVVCNIKVVSDVKEGSEIFHISTTNKTITNYGWNGSEGILTQIKTPFALFADLKLPRIYQIVLYADTYKLYTYSTYNNRWQETKKFGIAVTSIWEIESK